MAVYLVKYKESDVVGVWDTDLSTVAFEQTPENMARHIDRLELGGGCKKIIDRATNEVVYEAEE